MIQEQSKQILSGPQANRVVQGDCIEVLRGFSSRSVDFVLTDPPYLAHYCSRDGRRVASRFTGCMTMATASKLVRIPAAQSQSVPLLTAEDVSRITGLSVETLAQWRSQRRGIPFMKLSRNVVRYSQAELDRWLSERIVRVEQDPSNARRAS